MERGQQSTCLDLKRGRLPRLCLRESWPLGSAEMSLDALRTDL